METKETERTDATILVKIADKLLEAQREIDELVLQFALGKAEARDKFEETKKEFTGRVSEFKRSNLGTKIVDSSKKLKGALEELEVQLNLGKAESKEMFDEQKKKIEALIAKVRKEIKLVKEEVLEKEHLEHEIEKFKLKLEVLRLRFELRKFEVRDSFKENMQEVRKRIEQTASKLKEKLNPESSLNSFEKEVKGAYKRLRKVIQSI
jgi:hypothetical protein